MMRRWSSIVVLAAGLVAPVLGLRAGQVPLFDKQTSVAEAAEFLGAPKDKAGMISRGTLADKDHLTLARKLVDAWSARDSDAMMKLFSEKSVKAVAASDQPTMVTLWCKGMSSRLLPPDIENPKVVATCGKYDRTEPARAAQLKYSTDMETPDSFLTLYTYDPKAQVVNGRELLVVRSGGELKLVMSLPKLPAKQPSLAPAGK